MTHLITNYVNSVPPKPDFNVHNEINKTNLVKPLPGRGKLVNGNILNSPVLWVKNIGYDAKAFVHAAKGKANDHELGRINNTGLVAGGLGIAGYLFTKKLTPVTKGMEFIGLGSFLGSMMLWPKIAIQLPAYLIHGVNVQKQYEDSFGRRKDFYQDPQFIPWDLYSDKEINKIGDRLRVPKDIPNRRDFIQEKMRKIAVQNNTLWMLTAGFAAPIMSSLICNRIEPYMLKYVNNKRNKETDDILKQIDKYYKANSEEEKTKIFQSLENLTDTKKPVTTNLENLLSKYKNATLDEKLRGKLIEVFKDELDQETAKSFEKDFIQLFPLEEYRVEKSTAKALVENLYETFSGQDYDENFLKALFKDENWMTQFLTDNKRLNTIIREKTMDFENIESDLITAIQKNYEEFYTANPTAEKVPWNDIKTEIRAQKKKEHPVKISLKKIKAAVLDVTTQNKLKKLAGFFDNFAVKNNALNRYVGLKVGNEPETVAANYWNGISKEIINILGITPKEIERAKLDDSILAPILRDKIETISSDDASYKKVMKTLIDKITNIDKLVKKDDLKSHYLTGESSNTKYENLVDTIYDGFSEELKAEGFTKTSKAIFGIDKSDSVGTARNVQKAFAEHRLLGIKSSFYRIINALDFFRRVSTDANHIKGIDGQYREIKEEVIELCKYITLEGHSSDYSNKFYMLRNPNPNTEVSDVVVEKGKVKNLYYGKSPVTDIPGDKYFYQYGMQAMYESEMHADTLEAMGKNDLLKQEMTNYRKCMCEIMGGEYNFYKPNHRIREINETGSDIKFLLTGVSPKEFVYKNLQQTYNSRKWMKTFAPAGAALLGVTVFAQFFFGRMKNPKKAGNK